ncbi:MAG: hypothetical protein M1832_004930 [Thelocarpon impressellum]|nr:MAG: hypothetical protein M1832_004930 [Thelocarpon impressellum]
MAREASLQKFRQEAGDQEDTLLAGFFMWPASEIRPDAMLGSNLEALDPLRSQLRCFIGWEPDHSRLKILSGHRDSLGKAICRIRGTIGEVTARRIRPQKLFLVEHLESRTARREVELVAWAAPPSQLLAANLLTSACVVPVLAGPAAERRHHEAWDVLQADVALSNEGRLRSAMTGVLANIPPYRGYVSARVHFGVLCLTAYRKPTGSNHTLEDFTSMLGNAQTDGELIKNLEYEEDGTSLISFCRQASDWLDPVDAMTRSLADVEPHYSASFHLAPFGNSGSMRLDVAFVEASPGSFDMSLQRWLRTEDSALARDPLTGQWRGRMPLAACVMDLQRRTAWQFEIVTGNRMEEGRITPVMRDFADSIRLRAVATKGDDGTTKTSMSFSADELRVEGRAERTHYRYLLKNSTYLLEITRNRHFPAAKAGVSMKAQTTWEASLYNMEWDTTFQEQLTLRIGEAGSWKPDLDTFFPSSAAGEGREGRDGFSAFLEQVRVVVELLARRKSGKPDVLDGQGEGGPRKEKGNGEGK